MKKILSIILCLCFVLSMTACAEYDEVSELRNISALNSESSVTTNYNLSYQDEQEMIYAQVSDRQLLDLSTLDACTDSEIQQVINYMNSVDEQIIGNINVMNYSDITTKYFLEDLYNDEAILDTNFTNYLLWFFEKTPYYWQRTKTTIRGIDAESRSIVVDVQYKTIDFRKTVKEPSTIVKGAPNYDRMMENRFNRWVAILDMRLNSRVDEKIVNDAEAEFTKYYGDPKKIFEEQRGVSLTTSIYETGNQLTYTGNTDTEEELSHATCTVRFVLVPKYVLGVNLGIECKHMYVTDYQLTDDCTDGLTIFTQEGYATVTDSVYNLIYSYFTCIDESDFEGLYKLTHKFENLDKYYSDMFDTSYRKHEGFSVSLFDITGTHITCGVTISSKERAKGSEMTFPSYTDKYFMELELINDVLKVKNLVLLSRRIEGEPAITTDDADVSGFAAKIELNNDDRVAIENLICNFSALQLLNDTTSDNFSNVVDISMATSQKHSLVSNMTSLSGKNKVVWLRHYQQGTSNYASVKCRELFQSDDDSIVEADVTYDFILKGGKWYVYNYQIISSVKLDTTQLSTTNSLCLVSPGKVEAYTSQIKSTASTNLDGVSDTSVSFDHKEYVPTLKTAYNPDVFYELTLEDLTEVEANEVLSLIDREIRYDTINNMKTQITNAGISLMEPDVIKASEAFLDVVNKFLVVQYNINNELYLSDERYTLSREVTNEMKTVKAQLQALDVILSDEFDSVIEEPISALNLFINKLQPE